MDTKILTGAAVHFTQSSNVSQARYPRILSGIIGQQNGVGRDGMADRHTDGVQGKFDVASDLRRSPVPGNTASGLVCHDAITPLGIGVGRHPDPLALLRRVLYTGAQLYRLLAYNKRAERVSSLYVWPRLPLPLIPDQVLTLGQQVSVDFFLLQKNVPGGFHRPEDQHIAVAEDCR